MEPEPPSFNRDRRVSLSSLIHKVLQANGVLDPSRDLARAIAEAVSKRKALGFHGVNRRQRNRKLKELQCTGS
jgi:hypothetical protein